MKKLLIIIGVTVGLNTALADWPKKLWEKEWPGKIRDVDGMYYVGLDGRSVVLTVSYGETNQAKYWVSGSGEFYELSHNFNSLEYVMFFDSKNFIYYDFLENSNNGLKRVIKLSRVGFEVIKRQFEAKMAPFSTFGISQNSSRHIGFEIDNNKIICWDFTPPPSEDTGNEGGGGRLIIKTAGPDIALATDGKLGGAAELQKSNDLRSWRKLGDVPAEASEVLVTPRESGNEFYRLKKK